MKKCINLYQSSKKFTQEGLGIFTTEAIKKNSFLGITHIRDEQFFNNHSRIKKFGDAVDPTKRTEEVKNFMHFIKRKE